MTSPGATHARDELRITIQNDLGELARVNEIATRLLEEKHCAEARVYATQLALEEVLSNVIRHGFEDDARHEIVLVLRVAPGGVEIEVDDDGRAFDPLEAAPPNVHAPLAARRAGGLGIHLVRAFVRGIRYERREHRNHLWLWI